MSLVTGLYGLMDDTCYCGAHKKPRQTFCIRCYRSLNASQKAALYRRVGEGYEEAHASALTTLRKNGRVPEAADAAR